MLSDESDNASTYYYVHRIFGHIHGNYSSPKQSYWERVDPSEDDPNAPVVKISLENDKIKVQTDNDIAYAEPAKCNVDIVLAVPVNGAANNQYNQDAASVIAEGTTGTPEEGQATTSIPDNLQNTPLYQMGQECKEFAKKFYHTRGVNMSLIPYSGKISLYSTDWTRSTYGMGKHHDFVRGFYLYGSNGTKGKKLLDSYSWGTQLLGRPIMRRHGYFFPNY